MPLFNKLFFPFSFQGEGDKGDEVIKILHFADLHLGIESYGILNPETGLSARLEDFLAAFDKVVEYSISERVDLVLFCGDAYERKDPSQTYQREFARRMLKLSQAGIPVVLVPGNHDLHPSPNKASSVDIFAVLTSADPNLPSTTYHLPSTIHTSRRPQIFNISTKSGPIQVLSVPWLWRSQIMAKEEYSNLSFEAVNQEMSRIVVELINKQAQSISGESPAVLASHLWVTGSKIGSEQRYILEKDYSVLSSALALPAFDYVALGHIHSQQSFALDPPVAYAGSLERIDFSDEGIRKGFYLVEIDESKPRARREAACKFIELPVRKFVTLNIKLNTEELNPQTALMQEIERNSEKIRDAVVRLEIKWSHTTQMRPPDQEIRRSLKGAFLVSGIKWEMAQSSSGRLGHISSASSLKPLEALEEYFRVRKINPAEASELKSCAEKLLKEIEESQ